MKDARARQQKFDLDDGFTGLVEAKGLDGLQLNEPKPEPELLQSACILASVRTRQAEPRTQPALSGPQSCELHRAPFHHPFMVGRELLRTRLHCASQRTASACMPARRAWAAFGAASTGVAS